MIHRLVKLTKSTLLFFIEEIVDNTTSKSKANNTMFTQSRADSHAQTELKLD